MDRVSRRDFLKQGAGAAAGMAGLAGLGASGCASEEPLRVEPVTPKRPNLLFVFGDQWRRQALGFMNEDPVFTPHLDRFAQRSMVFTNAISCSPICSPYRATLMTGRYPLSNKVIWNGIQLPEDEFTFAEALQEAGYETSYIGKWHLNGPASQLVPPGPLRQGFDFWYANQCFHQHFHLRYFTGEREEITGEGWQPEHETDVAIRRIKNRRRDRPFALFLSWAPPHTISGGNRYNPKGERYQYPAPNIYEEMYRGRKLLRRPNVKDNYAAYALPGYFGCISSLDENFGRLMACLDQEGLREDTVVVFTSDHGEMLGSHGLMTKTYCLEESIGLPFLLSWPGRIRSKYEDLLFNSVDVMPSLLGLLGLPVPNSVEGTNYSDLFLGKEVKRPESALIEYFPKEMDLTEGWRGIRTERFTFVPRIEDNKIIGTLYDNVADPYQLNPVRAGLDDHPRMDKFWRLLKRWLEKTNDPWLRVSG
jgi:arylsulfatase A-like enzyme